jgi:hypothetical protein
MPKAVSKQQLLAAAAQLGPQYALDDVFTLSELGFQVVPRTSLGKVKKELLKAAVLERRRGTTIISARTSERPPPGSSSHATGMSSSLLVALRQIWQGLTGSKPSPAEPLVYSADSITLLRYCDRVWRVLGKRIYLQDMARNDTLEKQAHLLSGLDRTANGDVWSSATNGDRGTNLPHQPEDDHLSKSPPVNGIHGRIKSSSAFLTNSVIPDYTKRSPRLPAQQRAAAARRKLQDLGLEPSGLEDVCSIRESLRRTASGLRPRSFHLRTVFRIQGVPESQIRAGLEAALTARPMSRTILCYVGGTGDKLDGDGDLFHAVAKPSRVLFDRLICTSTVSTEEEAKRMYEAAGRLDEALSAYMFQANIITVRDAGDVREETTQQCLLALTYSHSTIDALSLYQFHQLLARLIADPASTVPPSTSYRLFTELFDEYRDSMSSRQAVSSYAKRLRGISRLFKKASWPRQNAPGLFIAGDDDDEDEEACPHAEERATARSKAWGGEWEGRAAAEFKYPRLGRVVSLPRLQHLRQLHGIPPPILAKCAVVLFNVLHTQSSHAILSTWESGRSWPFVPDWIAELLPPAMSIDGPTVQWVLDLIEVDQAETVSELLKRMVQEQEVVLSHQHAPWEKVVGELREEGPVAVDASFRQSFIWDMSLGLTASRGFRNDLQVLEPRARHDWADL